MGGEMKEELPKHGGPNSWKELRHGLINRKQTINKRNNQIKCLKGDLEKAKDRISELEKEIENQCFAHSERIVYLEKEVEEQCRLNGMGAQREARHLACIAELEKQITDEQLANIGLHQSLLKAKKENEEIKSLVDKYSHISEQAVILTKKIEAKNESLRREREEAVEAVKDLRYSLGDLLNHGLEYEGGETHQADGEKAKKVYESTAHLVKGNEKKG